MSRLSMTDGGIRSPFQLNESHGCLSPRADEFVRWFIYHGQTKPFIDIAALQTAKNEAKVLERKVSAVFRNPDPHTKDRHFADFLVSEATIYAGFAASGPCRRP
jgi:hypothetical protein